MSKVGVYIKRRREELGLTQEELATKMGYKSKSTIGKIEMGINDITQTKVEEFARILDTSVSYLMGWEDEEAKDIQNRIISGYLEDDKIKELVLFAGGMMPKEARDKFIEAFIAAGSALTK